MAALCIAGAVLVTAEAYAQQGSVTGRVTDAVTGEALVGAQVVIVGTNRGAITTAEGRFVIPGLEPGVVQVRAIMLGYESLTRDVQVAAGEAATVDFALTTTAIALDQVVVTVTGQQRARELANAIGTVDVGELTELSPTTNLTETLAAQTPGVAILQSSGTVGTGGIIKIRGNASISLDNTPLIYVDGVRINNSNDVDLDVGGQTSSRLNDINPNDIERIEVIKGPAAAALYGTEAGPGVIQIFTKRGRTGEATFNFRLGFGANVQTATDYPDRVMHPRSLGLPSDTLYSMNLMEEFDPLRTGEVRSYAGSVRGGTEGFTYFLSGEYQSEEGVLAANRGDRYYGRANFNIRTSDEVDFAISTGYTSNFFHFPQNDNNSLGYLGNALLGLAMLHRMDLTDPATGEVVQACPLELELAKASGASLAELAGTQCGPKDGFFGATDFDDISTITTEENTERLTGSVTMNWRPFDFLTNRITVGYDQNAIRYKSQVPNDPELPFGSLSLGNRFVDNTIVRNLTLEYGGSLEYSPTEDVQTTTSFGVQYFKEVTEVVHSEGQQFPAGAPSVGNAVVRDGDEDYFEERTIGFYIQEQIGWRDLLFFTPAIRLDDNSAFGQEADLAVYPKVGASYIVSEHDWFPETFLEQVKLRVAWGRSGKQPGIFDALQRYSVVPVAIRESDVSGAYPQNFGNADLKPEIGEEWEVGFDLGMFDGRLGLEFTYYDKTTKDAIVLRDLAPSAGFPGSVFTNLSEVYNSGIEVGLNATAVNRSNVRWDVAATFSTNDDEIGPLPAPIIFGLGGNSQRHQQGFPFGAYFGRKVGIDPATGEAGFVTDTAVFLGQPTPEWQSAISTTLTLFDHITLFALLDIQAGQSLYNSTEDFACGLLGGGEFGSLCPETYERGPDGEYTDEAKIKQFASSVGAIAPWVEDASFAKLRTVSVQWEMPSSWVQRFGASSASFTFSGQELATWTDYTGLDPEINFAAQDNQSRAEFLTLPRNRRFMGTLSITF
ncbi:MAG TPA: SusC/RagA family TonB-linked outer membrane protein [Longimicrobiales bacterium]